MQGKWLKWATEIQSIAQAGLTYSKDKFDLERFDQLMNISSQIISEYTDIELEKIKDIVYEESGYLTPKIDIRSAVIKDNKILLVKETSDGTWSLPGGWADVNLSISENIKKETKEEAGIEVIPKRIIAILDRNRHNVPISLQSIYKIFVLCEFISGEFIQNIETEDSRFFSIDNLPILSMARNTKEQVKMCFESYSKDNFETIFD